MARFVSFILFVSFLAAPTAVVRADDEGAEPAKVEPTEGDGTSEEVEKPVATFGGEYPVRFARRPLVMNEGMVRADGRLTVVGVIGPGTFSALDLGGAVSPI